MDGIRGHDFKLKKVMPKITKAKCLKARSKRWTATPKQTWSYTHLYIKCAVVLACNSAYSGGRYQEDRGSKPAQANKSQDPISKLPKRRNVAGVAQVTECLPSKHEVLSSKNLELPKFF
jgi:hypothetical protein